jgi:hypothetical protein
MRWKPKQWPARKAKRTREALAWDASDLEFSLSLILKDKWSDGWGRPAWAKLARARGWLTEAAYYAVRQSVRVPGIADLLYRDSPLLGMLRKDTDFGAKYGKAAAE